MFLPPLHGFPAVPVPPNDGMIGSLLYSENSTILQKTLSLKALQPTSEEFKKPRPSAKG